MPVISSLLACVVVRGRSGGGNNSAVMMVARSRRLFIIAMIVFTGFGSRTVLFGGAPLQFQRGSFPGSRLSHHKKSLAREGSCAVDLESGGVPDVDVACEIIDTSVGA